MFGFSAAGCAKVSIIYTVGIPLGGREKNIPVRSVLKRQKRSKKNQKKKQRVSAPRTSGDADAYGCIHKL